MQIFDAPILEEISGFDDADAIAGEFDVDEIGWFGSKIANRLGKIAKGVGKATSGVLKSKIFQGIVGVVAVAFPVVGIPAAAAVAAANIALKAAETGAGAAKELNATLTTLKVKATAGDAKAATAVNAMQVAMAARKAKALGIQRIRPVAVKGSKGSFSTTPIPLAALQAKQQPTSLYKPTQSPAVLASKLAAGGSPLGKKVLSAVTAGQSVAVPNGVAVIPGQKPTRHAKMWIGKVPAGTKGARLLKGASAVTKGGFVLSGQAVYVA